MEPRNVGSLESGLSIYILLIRRFAESVVDKSYIAMLNVQYYR